MPSAAGRALLWVTPCFALPPPPPLAGVRRGISCSQTNPGTSVVLRVLPPDSSGKPEIALGPAPSCRPRAPSSHRVLGGNSVILVPRGPATRCSVTANAGAMGRLREKAFNQTVVIIANFMRRIFGLVGDLVSFTKRGQCAQQQQRAQPGVCVRTPGFRGGVWVCFSGFPSSWGS